MTVNQKISNCTIFKKNSLANMPPNPLPHTKAWLHYHVAMCRVLLWHMQIYMSEKKILTPYQILYTLLAYMYKLIKDIKYKF